MREAGDRVVEMLVNQGGDYTAIEPYGEYRVTTNGFTGQGGDGYETVANVYDDGIIWLKLSAALSTQNAKTGLLI